ncbi:hypothetical protein MSAN_00609300 [Mycena sanguinolenta]|uniref:Uncharacterized protein n=1 Tax=Mycena sanguinolenta TaxID=230812 RepID=A0A8H6Z7I1_9AGAR|nr:hypothetical protein MSAN_00609300 [Mycena sanguinolenta]
MYLEAAISTKAPVGLQALRNPPSTFLAVRSVAGSVGVLSDPRMRLQLAPPSSFRNAASRFPRASAGFDIPPTQRPTVEYMTPAFSMLPPQAPRFLRMLPGRAEYPPRLQAAISSCYWSCAW